MQKLILLVSLFNLLSSSTAALAESYRGRCLYIDAETSENNFHSCRMTPSATTLTLTFNRERYQGGNKVITGDSITQMASGNYARRLLSDAGSLIGGILFSPISIGSRLLNRDHQQYVLYYKTQEKESATVVRVRREDTPQFQQELTSLTNCMVIRFKEPERSTIIDIGP